MNHKFTLSWILLTTFVAVTHQQTTAADDNDVTDAVDVMDTSDVVMPADDVTMEAAADTETEAQDESRAGEEEADDTTVHDSAAEESDESSTDTPEKKSESSTGKLVGIVLGSVLGVILLCAGVVVGALYFLKRRRNADDGRAKYTVANTDAEAAEAGSAEPVEVTKVENKLLDENKDAEN